MRAQSAPILHELFWTVYLLPMQFHLSLITPQSSLNFRGTFPLICPQKPCMTTSRSGDRICVLARSPRPRCMKPRRENLKVPRSLSEKEPVYQSIVAVGQMTDDNACSLLSNLMFRHHTETNDGRALQKNVSTLGAATLPTGGP